MASRPAGGAAPGDLGREALTAKVSPVPSALALELGATQAPEPTKPANVELIMGGSYKQVHGDADFVDDEFEEERHGSWKGITGDIITAVIGAGVLSIPYSVGVLGWVGGMFVMVLFAFITWYTAQLLASCYIWNGRRMRSYAQVVRESMGLGHEIFFGIIQFSNLFLSALAYNITGALSLQAVVCPTGGCEGRGYSYWVFAVIYGGIQLVVSQLPNMDSLWWISALGAIMSFGYSTMAIALSITYMATYGVAGGSVSGIEFSTSSNKTFAVLNAIGAITFAYSFSFIFIDMLDTVRRDAKGPMWHGHRAVSIGLVIITAFYLLVAITGYMAFGDAVCGELLTCFSVAPDGGRVATIPLWTIRWANAMVFVHVIPSYALFSHPLFAAVERAAARRRPELAGRKSMMTFRLVWRSAYVAVVCVLAACLPFFNDIVGLIGAIGFWPATVLYPVEMYIRKYNVKGALWWAMEALNVFCFCITVLAIVGSVQVIISSASSYKPFQD